jgi:hypothetical protein
MQLRSNIALKLFALILFTIEFLAPSLVTGLADTSQNKTQFVNVSQFHNPLFSLFIEELYDNEEGKEFDRDHSSNNNLYSSQTSQYLFKSEFITHGFTHSLLQFDTRPPLFRLHCILLI